MEGNNPCGLGLGSRLFWAVLFKREGIAFWLHFLEKFAGSTVVGKTPYGMLTEEQNRLLNTLLSVRTASAIPAPIGTEIAFLEASRSGTVTYEQFVDYWDRQISICVTGETLTTQVGAKGGNRALGEVHQEQLDVLADSDGDLLTDTLRSQLCQWIVDCNLPGAAVPSVWRIRPKNEQAEAGTRKIKAEAAKVLDEAIKQIVKQAAAFEDDEVAREYIVSFDITDALRQMRDPDLVKIRPYWRYRHADTRVPMNPRPEHVAWNGLVLMHDDPWWDTHFPPNDWKCSCGVETLSRGDLRRLGKSGPDTAPEIVRAPFTHKASGETVMLPEGIGYGWDYMPGDKWQRGLVPDLLDALPGDPPQLSDLPQMVEAGARAPAARESIEDLRAKGRPFKSQILPEGQAPEVYVAAFLQAFGLAPGEAKLWTDVEGGRILIADDMFRQRSGLWKSMVRGHGDHALLLAEALQDPDEIWISLRAVPDPDAPDDPAKTAYEIVRRYIRVDPDRPVFAMFELGRRVWFPVTGFGPLNRAHPDFAYIDKQRAGKLIWKRK